jgi:hypothetical protein
MVVAGLRAASDIVVPIGMLLSLPLSMTVKIAPDHNENTRWPGTLPGSRIPE